MDFTERTPIEAGFAPVFRERVAPELDRLEAERRRCEPQPPAARIARSPAR
jgi:hypothetical protein